MWRSSKPSRRNTNRVFSEILKHAEVLKDVEMRIMDSENERETFETNKGWF